MMQFSCQPRATILSGHAIAAIHDSALALLETIGLAVPHADIRQRLIALGGQTTGNHRVRFDRSLVAAALARTPSQYDLFGLNGTPQARFGVGHRNINSIAGQAHWLTNGVRRPCRLDDVRLATHFGEHLSHINIVGAMADPQELPVAVRCVHVAATLLKHTTKPITFWYYDGASAAFINELLIAVAGSEATAKAQPRTYAFFEPISPLSFPRDGLDVVQQTRRLNLPVSIGPMAQAGATAPVTLAGTLAQEHAEILAGIVAVQMIQPDTPICYGGICHAFDMATTQMIFSGPEQAVLAIGATQLGQSLNLPVYVNVGLTDSKAPDAQAGLESAATLLSGMMAGADIFGHMGICGVDQAASLEMLILQNEIIRYIDRIARGFDVSPDTLAQDVIANVVARGTTYLDADHTAEHFRNELWFPQLLDRQFFAMWDAQGRRTLTDAIVDRHAQLIRMPIQPVLSDAQCKDLDRIVADAEKHLLK
jgi:trimethylamine--corrinoid protein Co-methyltransferase